MKPSLSALERKQLVLDNMGFADALATKEHRRLGLVAIEDLKSYAYLGLVDAAHKYAPKKNIKFNTYAYHRIKGAMLDGLREQDWLGKLDRKRVKKGELNFRLVQTDHVDFDVQADNKINNINITVDHFNPLEYECMHKTFELEEEKITILAAVNTLPGKTKHCVVDYYYKDKTMTEIAKDLNLCESRVSQLTTIGINILKKRIPKNL